jgi:hypothetical protein
MPGRPATNWVRFDRREPCWNTRSGGRVVRRRRQDTYRGGDRAHDDGSNPARNTMELTLASPESIHALMPGYGNPTPVLLRRGAQEVARPANKGRKLRCKCGQCWQCLDDARWERIFAEKFLDPNYYTGPVTHMASPLTSH